MSIQGKFPENWETVRSHLGPAGELLLDTSIYLEETMPKELVHATIMNAIIQKCLPDPISKDLSDKMGLKVAVEAIQRDFLEIYRASKTLGKNETIERLKEIKVDHQSLDALKGLKGKMGVYIHLIHGDDDFWRVYCGKSDCLASRLKQHENPNRWRTEPSLHYHSRDNCKDHFFVIFALLQAESSRMLPLLELLACLLTKAMQPDLMSNWLPPGACGVGDYGLNIAPIFEKHGISTSVTLQHSQDKLAQEFFRQRYS